MRRLRYCWFLFLLTFSPSIFAEEFTWRATFNNQTVTGQPTPDAACSAVIAQNCANGGRCDVDLLAVERSTNTTYRCRWKHTNQTTSTTYTFNTTRNGTVCPSGQSLNSDTGLCDCPVGQSKDNATGQCNTDNPCSDKQGIDKVFTKTGVSGDGFGEMSGPFFSHGQSGCFDGCALEIPIGSTKCRAKVTGEYACKGTGRHTGQQCLPGPLDFDDIETPLPPLEYQKQEPCTYVQQADGTLACTSNNLKGKQGQYCGTVNGVHTCVNSPPSENGIKIDTSIKTTQNSDGTTSTIKTDTSTTTKCTGLGQCTISTTTKTTTTTTNAAGVVTGVTGSCEGPQCPDENTNPDGDGDGFGDCTGTCEDGQGGSGDWYSSGDDTYASVIGDFANAVKNLPVTQGVSNFLTFTPSGTCPVWETTAWVFSIRLDQWCTGSTIPWDLIKAVILGCCAFLAFRIAFL